VANLFGYSLMIPNPIHRLQSSVLGLIH